MLHVPIRLIKTKQKEKKRLQHVGAALLKFEFKCLYHRPFNQATDTGIFKYTIITLDEAWLYNESTCRFNGP